MCLTFVNPYSGQTFNLKCADSSSYNRYSVDNTKVQKWGGGGTRICYKNEPGSALRFKGGPGGSGSGFGNFEEIGPLNRDLEPRKTSWVRYRCFSEIFWTILTSWLFQQFAMLQLQIISCKFYSDYMLLWFYQHKARKFLPWFKVHVSQWRWCVFFLLFSFLHSDGFLTQVAFCMYALSWSFCFSIIV